MLRLWMMTLLGILLGCGCSGGGKLPGVSPGDRSGDSDSDSEEPGAVDPEEKPEKGDSGGDGGEEVEPPKVSDDGTAFRLVKETEFNAPGFDQAFEYAYSTPIGWGYMDPMVVVHEGQVYTPAFYPCSLADKRLFCVQILKNGEAYSPPFSLADATMPAGFAATGGAYQTPMLFLGDGELLLAYAVFGERGGRGNTVIKIVALSLSDSPVWQDRLTYAPDPGIALGYIGGAMGPNKEIVIAGWENHEPGGYDSLATLLIMPPYNQVSVYAEGDKYVRSGSHYTFAPLYAQVVILDSGEVRIASTLTLGKNCAETGKPLTNYKIIVVHSTPQIGTPLKALWSDSADDVTADPQGLGKPCQWRNQRFGLDALAAPDGRVYTLYRASKLLDPAAPDNLAANEEYEQSFVLRLEGAVKVADLSVVFRPLIESGNDLDAMSLTRLSTGDYVITANQRLGTKRLLLTHTRDFETFAPPQEFEAPYGPGHSLKVNHPGRNGTVMGETLYIWHGGNHENDDNLNHFLRFRLLEFSLDAAE